MQVSRDATKSEPTWPGDDCDDAWYDHSAGEDHAFVPRFPEDRPS